MVDRSIEDNLEMAECCLDLMEQSEFSSRQTQRVRTLLNLVGDRPANSKRYNGIVTRLRLLENNDATGK